MTDRGLFICFALTGSAYFLIGVLNRLYFADNPLDTEFVSMAVGSLFTLFVQRIRVATPAPPPEPPPGV